MNIDEDPILLHFPTLLRRWDGSIARIWQLTTSHASLTVRVERPGKVGNLQISGGPIFIKGPREWVNCCIRVERDKDGNFVLFDRAAEVRIVTENLEIAENRKPLNAFTSVD